MNEFSFELNLIQLTIKLAQIKRINSNILNKKNSIAEFTTLMEKIKKKYMSYFR